jgi:uncharacterized lipoprotein YajG
MAKKFGPALTMIVGALMLTGCASTSRQTIDPSKLAAVSDGDCRRSLQKADRWMQIQA